MSLTRMPTLPALVSDLIIDSDSESDDETVLKTPPNPTIVRLPPFLAQSHKPISTLPPNQRPIAGSKRVHRFRETQGVDIGQGGGEVLQSITASPALEHKSFEELRMECYLQSRLATGSPPRAVDPTTTPWEVIPPAFNAFHVVRRVHSTHEDDVVMSV